MPEQVGQRDNYDRESAWLEENCGEGDVVPGAEWIGTVVNRYSWKITDRARVRAFVREHQ